MGSTTESHLPQMKINKYRALLDTCVLAPMPIADTLLRLAEEPAFYIPRWSRDIFNELSKTLHNQFGYSDEQVKRRISNMEMAFPDAMVTGYDSLVSSMTNHQNDRHVLAAAVRCGAHCIVSNNARHFPADSLSPYDLECLTADDFLRHQYHLNPDAFIGVLVEQANDIGWTLPRLISKHARSLRTLIITH